MLSMQQGEIMHKECVQAACMKEISGYKFVLGSKSGSVLIYSYENLKKIEKIYQLDNILKQPITCLDYAILQSGTAMPNNKAASVMKDLELLVFCGATSRNIYVLDLTTLQQIHSLNAESAHKQGVSQIKILKKFNFAQHMNETMLVSAGLDGKINIWNLLSGQAPLRVIDTRVKGLLHFEFMDEEKIMVVGGNKLRVMHLEEGKCLGDLEDPTEQVQNHYRAIVKSGNYIVTAKNDSSSILYVFQMK